MEIWAVYFLCLLALVQAQSYSTIRVRTRCSPDCRIESHKLVAQNERLFLNVSSNIEYFSRDCVCRMWTISASSGVSITLETLPDSLWWYDAGCRQTPTLYIYDGTWSYEPHLLTSGCQYDNGTIYTTRSSAVVVLRYSLGTDYSRFSISYSIQSSGVASTTTATTTTSTVAYSPTTYLFLTDLYGVNYINSLNYPQETYGQRFATWKLIADSVVTPVTIVLSLETFEVSPTDFPPVMCHSNITVYDGGSPSGSWGRRRVFCSDWGQEDIFTAYSGEAFVAVSIHHGSYRFSLRYSLQPTVAATTPTTTTNAYAATLCEAGYENDLYVSSNSWTVLQTPEYPGYYSGNLDCLRKVIAPANMVVRVLVKDIEMEGSYNCLYAGLKLYNVDSWGSTYTSPLTSICFNGDRSVDYYSISNRMIIKVQLPYGSRRKIKLHLMASYGNGYAASTLPTPSTPAVIMDDTSLYYGNGSLGIVIGGVVAGTLMLLAPVVIALRVLRRRRAVLRARLGLPNRPWGRTPSSCSAEHLLPPPYSSVVGEGDPPLYTVSEADRGYFLAMPLPFGGNRLRRREEGGEGEVAYQPFDEAPPSYEELHPDPAACSPLTSAPAEPPTSIMPTGSPTCVQQRADSSVQVSNLLYIADARADNSTADVGTNAGNHYIAASDSALSVITGLEASQQQKSETHQQKPESYQQKP